MGGPAGLPQAAGSPPRALPPTDAGFDDRSCVRKQDDPADSPDANNEWFRRRASGKAKTRRPWVKGSQDRRLSR
jgi:hypothetical protein